MSAKGILHISKIVCTSRPNCPCKFCGRVRLMMDQERARIASDWDEHASENQLAREYVTHFLTAREKEKS